MNRADFMKQLESLLTGIAPTEREEAIQYYSDYFDDAGAENEQEEEDGRKQWHFLECNPRFSGGVAFSCMAGYDMTANHLRGFTGDEMEAAADIKEQYIARRYGEYGMGEG